MSLRAAIITISTSKAAGKGEDLSGPELSAFAQELGAEIAGTDIVPDDFAQIAQLLRGWVDRGVELILTTGGTGFAPSDVTPEATRSVIDREAPGIAEAMRLAARDHTAYWYASRAVAGLADSTLIINFPGRPRSISECGAPLLGTLPHALALITQRSGASSHE